MPSRSSRSGARAQRRPGRRVEKRGTYVQETDGGVAPFAGHDEEEGFCSCSKCILPGGPPTEPGVAPVSPRATRAGAAGQRARTGPLQKIEQAREVERRHRERSVTGSRDFQGRAADGYRLARRRYWYWAGRLIRSSSARITRASSGVSAWIARKHFCNRPTCANVAPMMNSGSLA
jgi:hypothetical protein